MKNVRAPLLRPLRQGCYVNWVEGPEPTNTCEEKSDMKRGLKPRWAWLQFIRGGEAHNANALQTLFVVFRQPVRCIYHLHVIWILKVLVRSGRTKISRCNFKAFLGQNPAAAKMSSGHNVRSFSSLGVVVHLYCYSIPHLMISTGSNKATEQIEGADVKIDSSKKRRHALHSRGDFPFVFVQMYGSFFRDCFQ